MTVDEMRNHLRVEAGNLERVALRLQVSKWTLYRALRKLGLERLPAELTAAAKRRFRLPPLEAPR